MLLQVFTLTLNSTAQRDSSHYYICQRSAKLRLTITCTVQITRRFFPIGGSKHRHCKLHLPRSS